MSIKSFFVKIKKNVLFLNHGVKYMEERKKIKFDQFVFIGIYLILSVAVNQWINIAKYNNELGIKGILWFCDLTAILLGIGMILKNKSLVTVSLVTAVPAQLPWILDFFLEAAGNGMGRTAGIWGWGPEVFWATVNLHSIIIPLSFYGVSKLGFDEKALKYALLYGVFVLFLSYSLSPIDSNLNCVFYGCDEKDPGAGYLKYFLINSLLFWEIIFTFSFLAFKFFFKAIRKKGVENF